ncbi:hypothetical protein J32TS6_28580 [Virgibacillus pantothenticus]|nr:hypothetical protein J32TS6_28580 [Virgibacillus pantothenticus]
MSAKSAGPILQPQPPLVVSVVSFTLFFVIKKTSFLNISIPYYRTNFLILHIGGGYVYEYATKYSCFKL